MLVEGKGMALQTDTKQRHVFHMQQCRCKACTVVGQTAVAPECLAYSETAPSELMSAAL